VITRGNGREPPLTKRVRKIERRKNLSSPEEGYEEGKSDFWSDAGPRLGVMKGGKVIKVRKARSGKVKIQKTLRTKDGKKGEKTMDDLAVTG